MPDSPSSVYIHIPFCKRKCNYCSFVSFDNPSLQNEYIDALLQEINHSYKGEKLNTLYIGGGTPSLLTLENFERILKSFKLDSNTEITAELNPDSINTPYLKGLKSLGINRLSIGIQSFNDKILKIIGRLHDAERAIEAVKEAKEAGFENISLDFIYGLPEQSLEDYQNTLKTALSLEPQHISLYGLKIEDGSNFAKKKPANLADEDLQADMFVCSVELLKNNNQYDWYEFSNFAKRGFESKHNLNYWNNEEYYGFGVSAHGYVNGTRYSNFSTLAEYLKDSAQPFESNVLSNEEKLQEEIFLGFRKCAGIDIEKINQKYSIDFNEKYKNSLSKFLESKHIIPTPNGYKLSLEGILLSNLVLCEFI